MKQLRPARIMVAVLLFAAAAIPTSSFALSYDLELDVIYYQGGVVVGRAVYNACFGHIDSFWGQQGGTVKLERYTDCDDGTTRCYWYSWTGSEWKFLSGPDCRPPAGLTRPPRQLF